MDKHDVDFSILNNADKETKEQLAEIYSAAQRDKERVFRMSKRKYNINKNTNSSDIHYEDSVSGVEVYNIPKWKKALSIAAGIVAVAGIAGVSVAGLFNMKGPDVQYSIVDDETQTEETETVEEEPTVPEPTEGVVEASVEEESPQYDYNEIAENLTDEYLRLFNLIAYGIGTKDEDDIISFSVYDSENQDWTAAYGGERQFTRITDYSSCQEVYDALRSITTYDMYPEENYYDATLREGQEGDNGVSFKSYLGGDLSGYESGALLDMKTEDESESIGFYVNIATLIDYNGKLYRKDKIWLDEDQSVYTSDVEIAETSDNEFKATRLLRPAYTGYENSKFGEQWIFDFVLVDGEWKINSFVIGDRIEYYSAIAIQDYIDDFEEYEDLNIDCIPIVQGLEVTEYHPENRTAKARCTLRNKNGEDAAVITAEISLGNAKIINAETTRIN